MQIPELVAHRGYARHYPENTGASVRAAIDAGARYVEIDVQLTRDEVPVLFHDRSLKRLCGVDGAVHDFTAAELDGLRASDFDRFGYKFAQEPVATLAGFAQIIQAHPPVTAFVELKRSSLSRFGIALVLQRVLPALKAIPRQCALISYSLSALRAARAQTPLPLGFVIDHWRERTRDGVHELRPEYLFCDAEGLPRFGKLRFDQAALAVFEVTDPHQALTLAHRGVSLIETFAIAELKQGLALATGHAC